MKVRNFSALLLLMTFCVTGLFVIFIFAEITDQSWSFIESMRKRSMEEKNLKNMEIYVKERKEKGQKFQEIISSYCQTVNELSSIQQNLQEKKINPREFKIFSAMFYINPELRDILLSEKR